ncbi:branched-chain amino acid ABC transporter ATP-binding protein/permease [Actinomadura barringtoniae]|uniref:Branched-chain amino acid ABC transporter ATP-binding protein/permease n=1 Tax=Actinomadura barringtoniae TaxID=1427535 RepID=A0A939TEB4_9ACTN|nr:branched-chain amino acid ABC transporter ATP-binding protein/permease [Actinomadura barringtoniae]MBO2453175.1 branched-chain amino acid ABC transporter ATP-binding protein/permease [Actinomadura barringtoniae]
MTPTATARTALAGWPIVVGLVCVLPWLGLSGATIRLVTLIAILSLVVSGLNLTLGYAGELALGQVPLYAAGAYATGYIAINVVNDLLVCMLVAVVLAVVLGVVTGLPGLRLGGWALAITSFFIVLLIPSVINIFGDRLGGLEGLNGIPVPAVLGVELDGNAFYVVVIGVTACWFAVFRNIAVSRHGASFLVLKQSPVLATAVGTSTFATKVTVYALSAAPAGLAGCFSAYLDSFLSPSTFGLELAIVILAASILGGATSVYGAIVGAAIMEIGPLRITAFDKYSLVAYGAFLVVGGLLLRNGLAGVATRIGRRAAVRIGSRTAPADAAPTEAATVDFPAVQGLPLTVVGATKRFGGNVAVDDVSFEAEPGQITALVGPNGSGKTTLMNLISGYYTLDAGTIRLGDQVISGLRGHQVARRGVGRTFQTPLIPEGLSVQDSIITGRFARHRVSLLATALRLPRHWRALDAERRLSRRIMRTLGLTQQADTRAADLALGTRRMLELGRAIAGGSSAVLLDEVASGLDEDDIHGLVRVLTGMRDAGITILLVEHNFALVRALADRIVVLAEGRVIATGGPDEIAAHPEVLRIYLGQGGEITGTRIAADRLDSAVDTALDNAKADRA